MRDVIITLSIIIPIALVFEFINGFHDTANSIATTVSTRALSPRNAIIMAAVFNFIGAYISTRYNVGKGVASTISSGLIEKTDTYHVPQHVIISALIAAIIWGLFTWWRGLPSSSSHAIIGGLIGAAVIDSAGGQHIIWWGTGSSGPIGVIGKVILPLIASPIIGFIFAMLFMNLLYELLRWLSQRKVNKIFSKLQVLSAAFMAYSHGSNDAQKTMGIITMSLVTLTTTQNEHLPNFLTPVINSNGKATIPLIVIIMCAVTMAMGTSLGGWRIIKTMGVNMIKLTPVQGFAAETTAAIVIETASNLGMPLSTTHVISSTIMGVGAAKRVSAVRWSVARSVVSAWIITIPTAFTLGALIDLAMKPIFSFLS